MNAIAYTSVKERLSEMMDRVCLDHDPVIITRNRGQAVVIISLEDYESLSETNYLLRSPANASQLLNSISELNNGGGVQRQLSDAT